MLKNPQKIHHHAHHKEHNTHNDHYKELDPRGRSSGRLCNDIDGSWRCEPKKKNGQNEQGDGVDPPEHSPVQTKRYEPGRVDIRGICGVCGTIIDGIRRRIVYDRGVDS